MSSLNDWTAYRGLVWYSPYKLVYGHVAVLPLGIKNGFKCIIFKEDLIADDFKDLMMNNLTFKLSSATLENTFKRVFAHITRIDVYWW